MMNESNKSLQESTSSEKKLNQSKKAPRYQGRFIKESLGDKHKVAPGEEFIKSWTFRNGGETAWPEDLMFIQSSGDDMGALPRCVTQIVQPNEEYTWELEFKAPLQAGKYVSYFRMQTGNNIRFGHKVWCDIIVVEPEEEQQPKVEEKPEEPVEPEQPQAVEQPKEEPKAPEPEKSALEESKDNLTASQQAVKQPKTPKQLYFDQVAGVKDSDISLNLTQLFDFGYVDFDTNHNLLCKYKNHLEAVLNHLLDAQN